MKTKEEILAKLIKCSTVEIYSHGWVHTALRAMEEYRSQCDELPEDDLVEGKTKFNKEEITAAKYIRNSLIGKKGVDDFKKAYMAGEIVMADELSSIIASKDARIRELEEENAKRKLIIDQLTTQHP